MQIKNFLKHSKIGFQFGLKISNVTSKKEKSLLGELFVKYLLGWIRCIENCRFLVESGISFGGFSAFFVWGKFHIII
jgi:hypothetical protein